MPAKLRNVVLVAAHFTPSNLVNVHRARTWAQHLSEFGWNPIVVTTHQDYYEERLDWDLHGLVDGTLEVVRTRALPTRPVRIVGDIGIRALLPHYWALSRLARDRRMDFLHITIPSNFSALLGRMVHMRYGTPYGIDYNDPWVSDYGATIAPSLSKAYVVHQLARVLEPWAVRDADLITGVASAYFEPVLQRNPHLRGQAITAAMPFGIAELDYQHLEGSPRQPYLFDPNDGLVHMVYAGALLPRAHVLLDRLLAAVALLRDREPASVSKLRLHFVGTGKRADDPQGHTVLPYIERHGVGALVDEHPTRIPYLDVLTHLQAASGNLILGSTERHYTPSKAFQVIRAGRPVLALLHAESTARELLIRANAGTIVTLTDSSLPEPAQIAAALADFLRAIPSWQAPSNFAEFEAHTARASAQRFAAALDQAMLHPVGKP